MVTRSIRLIAAVLMMTACCLAQETKYQYFRTGNPQDATTKTQFGVALMGGGKDLDDAFRWMCEKSGGGDFLVIRATETTITTRTSLSFANRIQWLLSSYLRAKLLWIPK